MNIYFGQIYITPGVSFPWTIHFQKLLGETITSLVSAGPTFIAQYGEGWSLMFRISAKRGIDSSEIRGPSKFRKNSCVEYSIFLPFDQIPSGSAFAESALRLLLKSVREVFSNVGIDYVDLGAVQDQIVADLCADPRSFEISKQEAQQVVAPNRSLPPTLNSTSSVRGSED